MTRLPRQDLPEPRALKKRLRRRTQNPRRPSTYCPARAHIRGSVTPLSARRCRSKEHRRGVATELLGERGDLLPPPLDLEMRDPQFEKSSQHQVPIAVLELHARKRRLPLDGVTPSRHDDVMTDDEVLDEARADGFELEERGCQDAWVWASAEATIDGGRVFSRSGRRSTGSGTG